MNDKSYSPASGIESGTSSSSGTGRSGSLKIALAVISMAQLLIILDGTIANIALPHIGADLDMDESSLTWIITGYALVFGAFLLLGGRLGDRYGYRRVFSAGLVVVAVASAMAGFATDESVLLVARVVHGLGAALAAPAALALITTTFPVGDARTRAYGFYAAMSGVGSGAGLIIGGWLTSVDSLLGVQLSGWRLAFLINVPVALLAVLLARYTLVESERQRLRLDVWGALTSVVGLVTLVYGFTRAGEERGGWADPWTIVSIAAGVVLLVVFVMIEYRSSHPLLPLRIFRSRDRSASLIAMFLAFGGMFSIFYFLTVLLQRVLGYTSLQAGVAFLPFALGIIVGAMLAAKLLARLDPRYVAAGGMLLSAFSLFMLSRISITGEPEALADAVLKTGFIGQSVNYWTDLFPYLVTTALGFGAIVAALTPTSVHRVDAEDIGVASGALNTVQQIGGAMGLAVLATIALHTARTGRDGVRETLSEALAGNQPALDAAVSQLGFVQGTTHALLIASFTMLVALVVTALFLRTSRSELGNDDSSQA